LPASAAAQLALLRTTPGIDLTIEGERFWLHGQELNQELEIQLRCLAGAERFTVLADRQLIPHGCLVPTATLPAGPWIKIQAWLTMIRPTPGYAGRVSEVIPLRLVRGDCEIASTGLLTRLTHLAAYAATAFAGRLDNCRFAAADEGRVFVMGQPLPAVPGQYYYECHRIWIPAGWTWAPAVDAELIHELLKLEAREHLLWEASHALHRLDEADFVKVSRASLQTTVAALGKTTPLLGVP